MRPANSRFGARPWWYAGALLVLAAACAAADPMQVLLVGGGPSPEHNQVAIESNVRYVLQLLPTDASPSVYFADGNPRHQTVLYEQPAKPLSAAERLLLVVLDGPDAVGGGPTRFRTPELPRIDGATKRVDLQNALAKLSANVQDHGPILLYFTGHGSPSRDMNLDNNVFDLWDGTLSVKDLAASVARLPADRPVTVVMVQCFSGAFGNLVFENGDPTGKLVDRDIAGFFATVRERPAAGCTPEVNEAEYHDFTSYFFAALTGRDRVGRAVTGADYNHDGRVGMDEAYCYALAHDRSIDVPVCTSDVFLRRFVHTPDRQVFAAPYASVREWASAGQRAALEALSATLKLSGDDRGHAAYQRFLASGDDDPDTGALAGARRALEAARVRARAALLARHPGLGDPHAAGFADACAAAVSSLQRRSEESPYREVLAADQALQSAEQKAYESEISSARLIRFVRLFKSIVLAHELKGGDPAVKGRYERLLAAEGRTLLPHYGAAIASKG